MRGTYRGFSRAAVIAAMVLAVGAPSLAAANSKDDLGNACLLAGEVYTKAKISDLRVTFVLVDMATSEVVWDVDPELMYTKSVKGGYEISAFIPSDPDMEGQVFEWALRVDARDAGSPVYVDWFEQVVSDAWSQILGDSTIAVYPGGDISGRVELVAITKSGKAGGSNGSNHGKKKGWD